MLKDVGGIPIVSFDFFKGLLPRPPVEISVIKQRLRNEGHLTQKGWKLWPKTPSQTSGNEDEVFKAFAELIEDITSSTERELNGTSKRTLSHLNNPTLTPLGNRVNTTKPDGCSVLHPAVDESTGLEDPLRPYAKLLQELLRDKGTQIGSVSSSDLFWEDIAVPHKYKKGNGKTDRADVRMIALSLIQADRVVF